VFFYIGMGGKPNPNGSLFKRLGQHANGALSGDKFCCYVMERLVVPDVTAEQQERLRAGELRLDALTKEYIHTHFGYRYWEAPDGEAATTVEEAVKGGALSGVKPLLNR